MDQNLNLQAQSDMLTFMQVLHLQLPVALQRVNFDTAHAVRSTLKMDKYNTINTIQPPDNHTKK